MLKPLRRDHPLVVVGYRGAEASVMNDLFLSQATSNSFLHGVYWCMLSGEHDSALSPLVMQLADAIGSNFQVVPISGFDDLFETDLLASMTAAGARPTRRPSGYSACGMPADMRPLDGFPISGFERSLLQARLSQYAERTDLWRPGAIDELVDRGDDRSARSGTANGSLRRSHSCRMVAFFGQSFGAISSGPRRISGRWTVALAPRLLWRGH